MANRPKFIAEGSRIIASLTALDNKTASALGEVQKEHLHATIGEYQRTVAALKEQHNKIIDKETDYAIQTLLKVYKGYDEVKLQESESPIKAFHSVLILG